MSKPLTQTTAEKQALQDTAAHSLPHRRELARRLSGGIEVTLYWSPTTTPPASRSRNPQPKKRCSSTSHASVRSTPSTTPSATSPRRERDGTPDRERPRTLPKQIRPYLQGVRWRIRFRLRPARLRPRDRGRRPVRARGLRA